MSLRWRQNDDAARQVFAIGSHRPEQQSVFTAQALPEDLQPAPGLIGWQTIGVPLHWPLQHWPPVVQVMPSLVQVAWQTPPLQLRPQHSAPVAHVEPVGLQAIGCVHFLVALSQVPEQHSALVAQVAACGKQACAQVLLLASQSPEQQPALSVQACPKFRQDIMIVEQVLVPGSQVPLQQSV
jgi:hypothetical protein